MLSRENQVVHWTRSNGLEGYLKMEDNPTNDSILCEMVSRFKRICEKLMKQIIDSQIKQELSERISNRFFLSIYLYNRDSEEYLVYG